VHRAGTDAPNILLVVMDTARADAFEPYGAPSGATPTVAQLASIGHAYRDVFSTANWTVPAHASLFTGLHPSTTGLGQAAGGPFGCRHRLEALKTRMLPEVLRNAGYATAGVSTNMWITNHSGFATGFDRFEVVRPEHRARINGGRLRDRLLWDLDAVRAVQDDGAADVARVLKRWLEESRGGSFFWFVNLTECHSPYLPPRPYNDLAIWDRIRAGEESRRHLTLSEIWKVCLGAGVIPAGALARMRHLYTRSIRYMDDWLARVLDLLDREGVLEETVVIVTSDHGENLGESDLIGHAFSLDDRLIRVPFITSHNDVLGGVGAQSLADVPGALANLIGARDHPYDGASSTSGIAVAELERLLEPSDPRVEKACDEWQLNEIGLSRLTTSAWCATDGRYKLVHNGSEETLYDLADDPLELEPMAVSGSLSAALSAVVADLHRAGEETLRRGLDDLEDMSADSKRARSAASEVSAEELEAIESQMRRLGYL